MVAYAHSFFPYFIGGTYSSDPRFGSSSFHICNFLDLVFIQKIFSFSLQFLESWQSLRLWRSKGCLSRKCGACPAYCGKCGGLIEGLKVYTVYILESIKFDRYYIGCTKDLSKRLKTHNEEKVRSTKAYCPWKVVYTENYGSKISAYKREKVIKSYKSGEAFKRLLHK